MDRRTILKGAGTALIGGIGITGTGTVTAEKGTGNLPNDNVPHKDVWPFSGEQEVKTGEWIVHKIAWIGVPPHSRQEEGETYVSTKDEMERFLDSVTAIVEIGGEKVENADQYWRDIIEIDGGYLAVWKYATPPKKPGTYRYKFTKKFTSDYRIDEPSGIQYEKGDVTSTVGQYRVVKVRGKRGN